MLLWYYASFPIPQGPIFLQCFLSSERILSGISFSPSFAGFKNITLASQILNNQYKLPSAFHRAAYTFCIICSQTLPALQPVFRVIIILHYAVCFFVARMKIPRNTTASTIPTGYATAVPRFKHSFAQKKYVMETALMKVAGTAVSQ